jgi:hypothetical protein
MVEGSPALDLHSQSKTELRILGEEERVLGAVVVACHVTMVHLLVLPQNVYDHDRHMLEVGVLEVESAELEGCLLIIPT